MFFLVQLQNLLEVIEIFVHAVSLLEFASKRPFSARSHAPLALAFAAHFACYLKWSARSLATGKRVPNNDSILVTVLTTRKQAPIKMALNLTSKSKGTEQNKILINSYSADGEDPESEVGDPAQSRACLQ